LADRAFARAIAQNLPENSVFVVAQRDDDLRTRTMAVWATGARTLTVRLDRR
jgi:hypothetical protein